jgi:PAS domain S-box-containing protein
MIRTLKIHRLEVRLRQLLLPASIRSKLIFLGISAFLPVILLTIFNSWQQRRSDVADAKGRMERILNFAVLYEEENVRETERILAMLAEIPIVRDGGNPASEYLARFLKNSPEYANIGIIRADGQVISGVVPFDKPVNLSDRSYFRDVLKTRSFSVGRYQVGRITGKPVITFGYPILDRQGNVSAVIFAGLDLSLVTKFEAEIDVQTPKDSSYVKLDDHGAVLTSHPATQVFGRGHTLGKPLFERISGEKRGMFFAVGVDGVKRLYVFSPFRGPLSKEGGYALLGIPAKTLFAETNRLLVKNLAVLSVVCLLFLAIMWFGGNILIVRPVGALVDATKRLAVGDLAARSGLVPKQGEIGQLGRAFDEMAEKLERGYHESRRMQETVRESEERFRNIFRENSSVMLLIDPDSGRIEDANPAAAAFYGYPEDALRTMTIGRINTLSEAEIAAERARALNKELDCFTFPHRFANGEIRTVEVHSSPVNVGGRSLLFSIIHDITDQKRAEETARRETALRNILLDNMPCIALVQKKRTREIVACNEIAKNHGAAVGKVCYDVLGVPGVPCPFCLAPEVWETGETRQIEVEYMGKFWQGIWVPFSDDLYVHYIFEITDRKRSEAEKEKLQAQLLQAMKMEAVGRLAGGVAHDFNNLLTVIIGNVSMVQAKLSTDDPVTGALVEANKAAERAAALTQQLLAFSRKQIIEPKILNLNDLIADLNAMLVRLIREDIKIRILPGKDLGVARIDVGQFQQVLVNLVVNARDSMPGGGKIVIETSNAELDDGYCSAHPYVKPGRFVMIAVSDTGHGMSDEVKAHIFEPFFTTKAKEGGTGLGLSTTYGVVKQAGGSIEVYSEVGVGTTFKIYLPRTEGEASQPARDDQPRKPPGGTETVLLVEDEDMVRDLCVSVLDELGYRVLQASGGEQAIALSKAHGGRIDLLMTDVVMPGMNGRELATRLVVDHPETRVLFTSGYTENVILHHGVLDDSVSFLGKPYSPSTLAKKIREVLDKAG